MGSQVNAGDIIGRRVEIGILLALEPAGGTREVIERNCSPSSEVKAEEAGNDTAVRSRHRGSGPHPVSQQPAAHMGIAARHIG